MKSQTRWPMELETLWQEAMNTSIYYKKSNPLLSEIYEKNADMIFKAAFTVYEAQGGR